MRCAACGARAVHLHHVLPKAAIKREGYAGHWLRDARNAMPLCMACHFGHENWRPRLPRHMVPTSAWEFAAELGPWATARLERAYPVARVGEDSSHGDAATAAGASGA